MAKELIIEIFGYMRAHKKYWLAPILILLLLLGMFIVFTEGSALAPFLYPLF